MRKRTYRAVAVKLCETPPKPSREGGTHRLCRWGRRRPLTQSTDCNGRDI